MPPLAQDGGRAVFAWLREMREQRPVWRDANEFWNVFRYADVQRSAADPAAFSSDLSPLNPALSHVQRGTLTRMVTLHHRPLVMSRPAPSSR